MDYYYSDIVLSDVPGEISLAFAIAECPINCPECFWQELKQSAPRQKLDDPEFQRIVTSYQDYVSCVLFYGGEWLSEELLSKLRYAQACGLKTCLYSGRTTLDPRLAPYLTYFKSGAYRKELGGLTNPSTNQRLINLITGQDLTYLFWSPLARARNAS